VSAGTGLNAVGLIRAKREGAELTPDQLHALLVAYLSGEVGDEQMAAFLMAVCWRGMSAPELSAWTGAMLGSGVRLDLDAAGRPTVDKHSTGGVGDKVSLVLVPLVAACGAAVPQMSGRGLGHTGGTLDKLEVIPGWQSELSPERIVRQLREVGCVICAAGQELVPADRRLYALRDVTATVESIPLIASSIISKKVAEGTQALLLDVKVGSGAFMKDLTAAHALARTMMNLGAAYGVRTSAWLTPMDAPLGRAVGNAVELSEATEALEGGGPEDLRRLVLEEAREMLRLARIEADPELALRDGRAATVFREMVLAQGGDPDAPLPRGDSLALVRAPAGGFLQGLDALAVGTAAWSLGAGRSRQGDPVSATAGVLCLVKPGEAVAEGEAVLELVGDNRAGLPAALAALEGVIRVGASRPPQQPVVMSRYPAD
jgi:thymidine phosphorylase